MPDVLDRPMVKKQATPDEPSREGSQTLRISRAAWLASYQAAANRGIRHGDYVSQLIMANSPEENRNHARKILRDEK